MSDRAMEHETMLASLRDIRLPGHAPGGVWAELAVAIGLAALLAVVLVALVRLLSLRRVSSPQSAGIDLSALAQLPEDARRVALLHILRARAPERYAALREGIYHPESAADTAALEAEVARLA